MPPRAKSAVSGPFDITSKIGQEGIPFLTLPYSDVLNSQILVNTSDNAVRALVASQQGFNPIYLTVLSEITICGSVQGYLTPIKRQTIRAGWGPVCLRIGDSDAYDQIVFRGRLFIGGKPGVPTDAVFKVPLVVTATVHVQAREGLGGGR